MRMKLNDVVATAVTNLRWVLATEIVESLLYVPIESFETALVLDGVEQLKAVRSGCHEIIGCAHVEEDAWNTDIANRLRGIVSDIIPTLVVYEKEAGYGR